MMIPTGTQGAKAAPRELDIALEGGPDFINRLKTLAAAKDEAAQAYARLQIGSDVIAARDDAERTLRLAENAKADADAAKADAEAYSAKVRREADDYSAAVRQDADKYAARLREEIHVAKSHAEEAKQSALTVQAEAKQNKAEAERLIAENTEKQQALDARTAKFKSGLLELQREFGDDGHKLSVPPLTEGELQALERVQ
jgi:hypothetical protein